jgi:hypothetical protein
MHLGIRTVHLHCPQWVGTKASRDLEQPGAACRDPRLMIHKTFFLSLACGYNGGRIPLRVALLVPAYITTEAVK